MIQPHQMVDLHFPSLVGHGKPECFLPDTYKPSAHNSVSVREEDQDAFALLDCLVTLPVEIYKRVESAIY